MLTQKQKIGIRIAVGAGTVLLIVIIVVILVIKKDTTKQSSTTKRINNVTYTDVNDGPHRIIGNDFYYNYYKGSFDKPYAGTWIGPNAYAVFIVGRRGWIVMKIASDFTMKTAFKAEESTYVPTVADIDTLTTGKAPLAWTGNLAET